MTHACSSAVLFCARIKPVVPTSEPSSLSIEYITVVTRMCSCIGILQKYAVGDDWEDYSDRLKQYFVANNSDDSILRKLLPKSDRNLAKVMEIVTACMQTAESLCAISNKLKVIQQDPSFNKVTFGCKQKCFSKPPHSPPPPDVYESTRKVGLTCWHCGGNHQAFQRRYRNYTCDNRGKRGHLKCRS